ncbi:MAG: hypothetical protein MI754_16930 [Chromatiales bacterium]|nr:hypothetical protein [Chromatiales bacterium]
MRPFHIENLIQQHGLPELSTETLDQFLEQHHQVMLFFTENPDQFPETNDVAVVLPELMKVFGDRLSAAVVALKSQRELQKRYGFKTWPSLVFLRDGAYLGVISRVQNWSEYLQEIESILSLEPSRPPTIGIPVVEEPMGNSV